MVFNSTGAVSHGFGSQHFYKVVFNDGLVAYWTLDEGGGLSLGDQSGYGNALTLSSGSFTAAVPALAFYDPAALSFDGTLYAHLTGTGTNLPAADGAQTVSLWLKLGSVLGTQDAVALGTAGNSGIKIGLSNGTLAAFGWDGTLLATATTPVDAGWHHVAFTYDGTTNSLYLDGVLASSSTVAHQTGATTLANLGSYDGTHETMAAGGAVDDVRVYNRALTATEISALGLGNAPATGVVTHTFTNALATNGDFVIASGKVLAGANTITATGSWLNYGGVYVATFGAVIMNGTSGTLQFGTQRVSALTISSGSYTLNDRLWANNRTVTVNGTLIDRSYVAHIGGFSGTGTFTPGTGTVVLDNTGAVTLSSAVNFYGLRFEDGIESNMVGNWKLDEGAGTTLNDVSGKNNSGTFAGTGTWVAGAGAIGFDNPAGLSFDGTTAYATLGANSMPSASASQTISFWAKYPSASATQTMVAAVNAGSTSGLYVGLSGGNLTASVYGGSTLVSTPAPSANTWHHIAYVYSSSVSPNDQLYVDGVAFSGGGSTTTHQAAAPSAVYLGAADGPSQFFQGQLDDVRIYATTLASAQIAQLVAGRYAGLSGLSTTTLGAALTVGGSLNVDAANLTANGFTTTVTGPATITDGTYTVGAAAQTFSGGLTVQTKGTVTLASATGSVLLGSGTSLILDGTLNASAAGATVASVSGRFTFEVGSVSGATPTLNISGLTVTGLDSHGMWINANTGATTTFTEFDNLAFSNGTGTQLLSIYAPTLNLASQG
ncbi:MAG: LamG domain-containing protein, partial [Polyangia bacterium]